MVGAPSGAGARRVSPVRLFLPAGSLGPATEAPQIVELSAQDGHYLLHVLRRRPGDPVTLCDGTIEAAAQILAPSSSSTGTGAGAAGVRLKTGAASLAPAPPPVQVTLLLGLLKGEKFDLVVQKATELGVHRVVPVRCARSVPVLSGHRAEGRRERWERIARAAAQQCRRSDLPEIGAPLPLDEALQRGEDLRLVFSEGAMGTSLHEVLPGRLPPRIAVLVGPEGGLSEEEVAAAQAAGFVLCGLGRRILRAETAALSALAILDHIAADPHRPHPAERSKIAISPLEL